jgi:hypothetical protein
MLVVYTIMYASHPQLTLSAIRLFNGTAALFASVALLAGLESTRKPTLLRSTRSGYSVFTPGSSALSCCCDTTNCAPPLPLRVAPVIHVLDAAAAVIAGAQGQLPRRGGTKGGIPSKSNNTLAVVAQTHKVEEACSPRKPRNMVRWMLAHSTSRCLAKD